MSNPLKALFNKLARHQIFTLSSGVLLANAVSFISMPILARMYSPQDFGCFAIYFAISVIGGTFTTARLEIAIPIADHVDEVGRLVKLCMLSTCITLSVGSVILFALDLSPYLGGTHNLMEFKLLTLASTLGTSLVQIFSQVRIRQSEFRNISLRHIFDRLVTVAVAIALAEATWTSFGLLWGQFFGIFASALLLIGRNHALLLHTWPKSREAYWHLLKKYRDFPLKNSVTTGFQMLSAHLPPLIYTSAFSVTQIGYLSIMQRLTDAPTTIVGSSIGVIYYRHLLNVGDHHRKKLFKITLLISAMVLGLGGLITMLFAEPITRLLLGAEWIPATPFLMALVPLGVMRLVYILQQSFFIIKRRLDLEMYISAGYLMLTLITLSVGVMLERPLVEVVTMTAGIGVAVYALGLLTIWLLVKNVLPAKPT